MQHLSREDQKEQNHITDRFNVALFLFSPFPVSDVSYGAISTICANRYHKSNRKAMNRNWSNQKANPALKTKTGDK